MSKTSRLEAASVTSSPVLWQPDGRGHGLVWQYEGGPQPHSADFQAAEKFLLRSLLDYVKQQLREVER